MNTILKRRGFDLGTAPETHHATVPETNIIKELWHNDEPVFLPALLKKSVQDHAHNIKSAHLLMENILDTSEVTSFFEKEPYLSSFSKSFAIVANSMEEHDERAIEKIYFDAFEQGDENAVAEELWCKSSWLSFHEDDASLRFRFSWGLEGFEDVAADPVKQRWASELCDVLFPESAVITKNTDMLSILEAILDKEATFVEKIVFFNAPNGGAQMHEDVEHGHAGVVYAQLSGSTFWLSLAKPRLMDELIAFVSDKGQQQAIEAVLPEEQDRQSLFEMCKNREQLNNYMDEADHELVEAVFDRCPEFVAQLISKGYSNTLVAGDVLLLPQRDFDTAVWHSVFTLGDGPGEALSFAVR